MKDPILIAIISTLTAAVGGFFWLVIRWLKSGNVDAHKRIDDVQTTIARQSRDSSKKFTVIQNKISEQAEYNHENFAKRSDVIRANAQIMNQIELNHTQTMNEISSLRQALTDFMVKK